MPPGRRRRRGQRRARRKTYRAGCRATHVLDPDGYSIEAVYRGPRTRSARSVVPVPADPLL